MQAASLFLSDTEAQPAASAVTHRAKHPRTDGAPPFAALLGPAAASPDAAPRMPPAPRETTPETGSDRSPRGGAPRAEGAEAKARPGGAPPAAPTTTPRAKARAKAEPAPSVRHRTGSEPAPSTDRTHGPTPASDRSASHGPRLRSPAADAPTNTHPAHARAVRAQPAAASERTAPPPARASQPPQPTGTTPATANHADARQAGATQAGATPADGRQADARQVDAGQVDTTAQRPRSRPGAPAASRTPDTQTPAHRSDERHPGRTKGSSTEGSTQARSRGDGSTSADRTVSPARATAPDVRTRSAPGEPPSTPVPARAGSTEPAGPKGVDAPVEHARTAAQGAEPDATARSRNAPDLPARVSVAPAGSETADAPGALAKESAGPVTPDPARRGNGTPSASGTHPPDTPRAETSRRLTASGTNAPVQTEAQATRPAGDSTTAFRATIQQMRIVPGAPEARTPVPASPGEAPAAGRAAAVRAERRQASAHETGWYGRTTAREAGRTDDGKPANPDAPRLHGDSPQEAASRQATGENGARQGERERNRPSARTPDGGPGLAATAPQGARVEAPSQVPGASRPENWFRHLVDQAAQVPPSGDMQTLEMQLEDGDGTMIIRVLHSDDHVSVSVGLSEAGMRAQVQAHADRIQQALQAQYQKTVDFSLFQGHSGSAQDRSFSDTRHRAGRPLAALEPDAPAPPQPTAPTLPGAPREWVG